MRKKTVYLPLLFLTFIYLLSACSPLPNTPTPTLPPTDTPQSTPVPTTQPSDFERGKQQLTQWGIQLPDLNESDPVSPRDFYSLFVQAHEVLGGETDLSLMNPRFAADSIQKKMVALQILDAYALDNVFEASQPLSVPQALFDFMRLRDRLQLRLYDTPARTATVADLVDRINLTLAVATASANTQMDLQLPLSRQDLLGPDAPALDKPCTRLMIARAMVTAYEQLGGEIPENELAAQLEDTQDPYAIRANQFFIWLDGKRFEGDHTDRWDNPYFLQMSSFGYPIQSLLGIEEQKVPYRAVVAGLYALLSPLKELPLSPTREKVVLNEKPYDWHVYQLDTGPYGQVNCMPACVEMSFRFQGVADAPRTQDLRDKYPVDGRGWSDILAENVMLQRGLTFTASDVVSVEALAQALDAGNAVYVMYDTGAAEGHSVLLKGYVQNGQDIHFIVADPIHNLRDRWGYIGYTVSAAELVEKMLKHVPRYFIIPPQP